MKCLVGEGGEGWRGWEERGEDGGEERWVKRICRGEFLEIPKGGGAAWGGVRRRGEGD